MEYFAHSQREFVYKYVVMLSDTDQFKHMSFANYLKLMFLATDALCVSCFDATFLTNHRIRLINARMQFKKQTAAGENILIKVNSTEQNGPRFSLLHTFVIEGTGELVGLGRQTFETLDSNSQALAYTPKSLNNLLTPISVDGENLLYKY